MEVDGIGGWRRARVRERRVWKHPFERGISTNQTEKPQPTVVPFRCRVFVVVLAGKLKIFISFDGKKIRFVEKCTLCEEKNIARIENVNENNITIVHLIRDDQNW